ncbi:MAG: hypothetical protein HY039_00950 [Nitrospirae bacterium]|nr:hypothetical protein [Nitrospirota bacterium]
MCGFSGRGGWLATIGGRGPAPDPPPGPPAHGEDARSCDDDDMSDDDGFLDDCD